MEKLIKKIKEEKDKIKNKLKLIPKKLAQKRKEYITSANYEPIRAGFREEPAGLSRKREKDGKETQR